MNKINALDPRLKSFWVDGSLHARIWWKDSLIHYNTWIKNSLRDLNHSMNIKGLNFRADQWIKKYTSVNLIYNIFIKYKFCNVQSPITSPQCDVILSENHCIFPIIFTIKHSIKIPLRTQIWSIMVKFEVNIMKLKQMSSILEIWY